MVELDINNKMQLQMSCDAFYLLYCGEEPLDDANINEAEEIAAMFPDGFFIEDYDLVEEDKSLIEATFIPYRPSAFQADYYLQLTTTSRLEIHKLSDTELEYRLYNIDKGEKQDIWARNKVPIETNKYKLQFFKTRGGSIFYLRNFIKV